MTRPRPFWRARLLPACLALLGLNGAALLVYTLPRTIQERTLATRAATLEQEVAAQRQLSADLKRHADAIQTNTVDAERLMREVLQPRKTALLGTLEDIEKMTGEPGLKAGRRSFRPEEVKGTPLTRVVVTVPLKGTYQQLVGFLDQVERSSRFLTVDRISIARGRGTAADEANLSVSMSAYFLTNARGAGGG